MKIDCQFINWFHDDREFYKCNIVNQDIPEDEILEFVGPHEDGETNKDVTDVFFGYCTIKKIPQGLTEIFPKLENLVVLKSKLKNLSKIDMAEYQNLKGFMCVSNEIEFLPGDLFEDFEQLESVVFYNNKLGLIEYNILDGLDNLKYVDFRKNNDYNKCYSVYHEHKPNSTLQEIKYNLFEKCTELYPIKELRIFKNNSIFSDLENYINNENLKDFEIEINDQEFKVHKFLLAMRSPFFADMLRNDTFDDCMKLIDISPEIFKIILNFMYTDELVCKNEKDFLNIFVAASRFKIEKLKNLTAIKVMDQINDKNVLKIFHLSNEHDHEKLRLKAYEEIKRKFPTIKFKDEWAVNTEKVDQIIEAFEEKEEEIRKIEEKFQSLLNE